MCEVFGYFSPWSNQHSSVSIVTSLRIKDGAVVIRYTAGAIEFSSPPKRSDRV